MNVTLRHEQTWKDGLIYIIRHQGSIIFKGNTKGEAEAYVNGLRYFKSVETEDLTNASV